MNKTGHLRLPTLLAAILIGLGLNAQPWPKDINGNVRDEVLKISDGKIYSFDDWTQYAPAAAYAALGFIPGIEHESSLVKRGCTFIGGFGFLAATTLLTKEIAGEMRPDGSGYDSFPSGHSGKAFLGGHFLQTGGELAVWGYSSKSSHVSVVATKVHSVHADLLTSTDSASQRTAQSASVLLFLLSASSLTVSHSLCLLHQSSLQTRTVTQWSTTTRFTANSTTIP